jgi:hypothetical protein
MFSGSGKPQRTVSDKNYIFNEKQNPKKESGRKENITFFTSYYSF